MLFVAEDATEIFLQKSRVGFCLDLPLIVLYFPSFCVWLRSVTFMKRQIKSYCFISDERPKGCWEEICPRHVSEKEQRAPQRLYV